MPCSAGMPKAMSGKLRQLRFFGQPINVLWNRQP
jgi:hypothetical protein